MHPGRGRLRRATVAPRDVTFPAPAPKLENQGSYFGMYLCMKFNLLRSKVKIYQVRVCYEPFLVATQGAQALSDLSSSRRGPYLTMHQRGECAIPRRMDSRHTDCIARYVASQRSTNYGLDRRMGGRGQPPHLNVLHPMHLMQHVRQRSCGRAPLA